MRSDNTPAREEPSDSPPLRLAVLIDADNAQASLIDPLLAEVARYGEATVRRIYGDFTSSHSASWKKVLQPHAIKPVQQFAYTTGKNATDSALIIDAMDLLYTRRFDGFCLVTSDSDFTGLAMRLREEGLMVLGFGVKTTPEAFRKACHRFTYIELLRDQGPDEDRSENDPAQDTPKRPKLPRRFLLTALDETSDDNGWANLGAFGSYLNNVQPDFDPRTYGFRKLSDLVRARSDLFVTEERRTRSGQPILYVRAK